MTTTSRGRRAARFVLAACAAAVSLLAGELVWRVLVNQRYRAQLAVFDEPLFAATDDGALYGLRPSATVVHDIANPAGGPPTHAVYHVNADGFRAHPVWPPPQDGAQRLLFVGDSFTFGTGVQDGESFPHLCERMLKERGRDVFCINAGVPGHDSGQTLARLRWLLPRYRPVHVVLGFVLNDAEPPTYAPIPPAMARQHARSWLFADGKRAINALGALLVADAPLLHTYERDYDADPLPGWTATSPKATDCLRALTAMQAECAAAGAKLTIATLPSFCVPFDGDYPYCGIHDQVTAHARASGAFALDAFPPLRGADSSALAVPGDGHPNAAGHARLAQILTEHLAAVLP